jgi:hypothetical protein
MYIATIPNRNSPPAILLRQAYRENGKAENRTLANLSHWQPARIEALRRALRGEFDQAALSTEPTLGPIFGPLYVLKQIAEVLGITAALSNTTLGKLALFLVLVRLPHQGSRLSAVRWAEDHAVRRFSTSRSTICVPSRKDRAGPVPPLPGTQPPRLFLYDVTSSYLEGECNELGEFGYDRDGKRGTCKSSSGC